MQDDEEAEEERRGRDRSLGQGGICHLLRRLMRLLLLSQRKSGRKGLLQGFRWGICRLSQRVQGGSEGALDREFSVTWWRRKGESRDEEESGKSEEACEALLRVVWTSVTELLML